MNESHVLRADEKYPFLLELLDYCILQPESVYSALLIVIPCSENGGLEQYIPSCGGCPTERTSA